MKENYFISELDVEAMGHIRDKSLYNRPLRNIKGKSALLILDMQKYFLDEDSHAFIPAAASIVEKISCIAEVFRESGLPVIKTRHVNSSDNAGMMNNWWKDLIEKDSPESEFVLEIESIPARVIEKNQYDAFYKSNLDEILRAAQVENLIISGVMTHLCCETTARSAFVRGYNVIFPADLNASYNSDYHLYTLRNICHGFGHVCFYSDIMNNRNIYA